MSENTLTKDAIVIERIFDAPPATVWQLWTEPEHFSKWYGPTGFDIVVTEMDVRVGGKRLFCMESSEMNMKVWLTGEHLEVSPTTRLVYTENMSDEHGNLVSHNSEDVVETEVRVELENLGGQTKMVMTHIGVPADLGATEGWEQSLDKLASIIETIRNK